MAEYKTIKDELDAILVRIDQFTDEELREASDSIYLHKRSENERVLEINRLFGRINQLTHDQNIIQKFTAKLELGYDIDDLQY